MRKITQIPVNFPFQSYFDSALRENAIVEWQPGSLFAGATRQQATMDAVGIALHPSSQSPIAVRVSGGDVDSSAFIVAPGHVYYPGHFTTIEYGLPAGWLGGGNVLVLILHDRSATLNFNQSEGSPIVFHRTRMIIEQAFPGTLRKNWPGTAPWQSAIATAALIPQGAGPILAIDPAQALLRLRSSIAAPVTLTFEWRGVDDLDVDSAGVDQVADLTMYSVTFDSVPAGSGGYPIAWLPPEVHRLMSSVGGVNVIDPANLQALNGTYIDVARYGRVS